MAIRHANFVVGIRRQALLHRRDHDETSLCSLEAKGASTTSAISTLHVTRRTLYQVCKSQVVGSLVRFYCPLALPFIS